jgi:hypothetical protein
LPQADKPSGVERADMLVGIGRQSDSAIAGAARDLQLTVRQKARCASGELIEAVLGIKHCRLIKFCDGARMVAQLRMAVAAIIENCGLARVTLRRQLARASATQGGGQRHDLQSPHRTHPKFSHDATTVCDTE